MSFVVLVKSTVEISQNLLAFSPYMNFTRMQMATDFEMKKQLTHKRMNVREHFFAWKSGPSSLNIEQCQFSRVSAILAKEKKA